MRGDDTDMDWQSVAITLVIVSIAGFVGFQIVGAVGDYTPIEQTEHYDQSEAWCDAEGGDLRVANDAYNADHNGLHCDTGGETYHMWAVADLNYTHNETALAEKCGATNVPLFIGCRGHSVLAVVAVLGGFVVVLGLVARFRDGDE